MPVVIGVIVFVLAVWAYNNSGVLAERASLILALLRSDDCVKLSDEHGFCGRGLGFVQKPGKQGVFVNPISREVLSFGNPTPWAACDELDDKAATNILNRWRAWQKETRGENIVARIHREDSDDPTVVVMRGLIKAKTKLGEGAYQDFSIVANCKRSLHVILTSVDAWPRLKTSFDDIRASITWPPDLNGALVK